MVECSDGVLAVGLVGSDGEDAVVRGRDALITSFVKYSRFIVFSPVMVNENCIFSEVNHIKMHVF